MNVGPISRDRHKPLEKNYKHLLCAFHADVFKKKSNTDKNMKIL